MNTILADSQFGFHHQHSTTQQLLLFLNKVHYCLNSNASCDVTYLDFHKAFDSVSHKLLIKLWNIGITGNLWLWIKKYLSDRHQRLCIDGCYSSSLTVISGVPQGSILGSLVCACQWPAPTSIIHISLWRWYQISKICLVGLRLFTAPTTPQSPIQLEYKLETLL